MFSACSQSSETMTRSNSFVETTRSFGAHSSTCGAKTWTRTVRVQTGGKICAVHVYWRRFGAFCVL